MALELREILGYELKDAAKYKSTNIVIPDNHPTDKLKDKNKDLQEFLTDDDMRDCFNVMIEAMHCAPFSTGNNTRYTTEACKKSLSKWTNPYNKPAIMYHNDYDGTIVGRVLKADMGHSDKTNTDCLMLQVSAPEYKTQCSLSNGILLSTSIGVSGTDVRCSICGQQLANGEMCEHIKGRTYNGEKCYWDVYDFVPKEISYVIVPSDIYSRVVKINDPVEYYQKTAVDTTSSEINFTNSLNNTEALKTQQCGSISIKESQNSDSNLKNKEKIGTIMDEKKYQETLALNESLTVENQALSNDKESLTEKVNELNKEKIAMQESIAEIKKQLGEEKSKADAAIQMKEQAEEENKKLLGEVKTALVDKLKSMRESAGRPPIEKLDERDLSYLRYAISDLEMELNLKENKTEETRLEDPTLHDDSQNISNNKELKEGANNTAGISLIL